MFFCSMNGNNIDENHIELSIQTPDKERNEQHIKEWIASESF